MICEDLRKGTPLRCTDGEGSSLSEGLVYFVDKYIRGYVHVTDSAGHRTGGWDLSRFAKVKTFDGADYQAADDCDLQGGAL